MSDYVTLWICAGLVYMFALQTHAVPGPGERWIAAVVVDVFWAFILIAAPFTFGIAALQRIFQ